MSGTHAELQELSRDESWRLLEQRSVGRLAISIQNQPDIFPVNYRIDGETIVIRTAPGLKLAAATLGQGVAFEVDLLDETQRIGLSVVVRGAAVEIDGLDNLLDAEDLGVDPWVGDGKHRFIRIIPEAVTGRRVVVVPGPSR